MVRNKTFLIRLPHWGLPHRESLKSSITGKFNFINGQFDNIRTDNKKSLEVIVADSLLEVKDSIIEALKGKKLKLQQKVKKL